MKHSKLAKALTIAALLSAASAAAAKTPLVTTNKWNVDFAEHQCLASRNYATAEKPLFLILKPSPVGDLMQVAVAWKSKKGEAVETKASVQFDEAAPISKSLIAFTAPKAGIRINSVNLPLGTFAPMRTAKTVSLRVGGANHHRFMLGPMAPLMRTIDRCLVDLKRHWNIGEEHSARLSQPPRSTKALSSYFATEDYPGVALRRRATGTVGFVVLVDETGKIGDCMVTETSDAASLDAQVCAIIVERTKFLPATAADGKPAKGMVMHRVHWALP